MTEDELRAIDEFIEYVETVARSPYQRDRALKAAGTRVSGAGLNTLRLIVREGPLPVNEVARRMGVDQSTASRQIRPLEDGGLVGRTEDEADRRVAWLVATADGLALVERVHGMRRDDIEFVFAEWPARDRAQLARLLDKLKQSMQDAPGRRAAG
jgi:DNA-binding MarR family transcriptional regulator